MSATTITVVDESCGAFRNPALADLQADSVHRMVVGEDRGPRLLDADEARGELGDAFAVRLLLRGVFPRTASDVLEALAQAAGDDPRLGENRFFLVGEGTQIPFTPEADQVRRNLRFVATTGFGPEGPDVMIASFQPDETDVELMAWDLEHGGFNYYRTVGNNTAWVYAGNSRHALLEDSEFKGPFESHPSGNFLMKELRLPWLHWHSVRAPVQANIFKVDDPLRDHVWFREVSDAYTLEEQVAKPSIRRWTNARFEALLANQPIRRPERIMRQLLKTDTVNIISSQTESRLATKIDAVDLPQAFFVDTQALAGILRLPAPPAFMVPGEIYKNSLEKFRFRLSDTAGFELPGDTHFAFAVPERAFEDEAVVRKSIEVGLLSDRLAACLLMTDFPNPVFSMRRSKLLDHVPDNATVEDGQSTFSEQMAESIVTASQDASPDSPEAEFAELWATGDGWRDQFGQRLTEYYNAVSQRLQTEEGFDEYCRLAETRREAVRAMPIFESELLFPMTDIDPTSRTMLPDGTVIDAQ